jgi:hypothetical protein
MVAEGLAGWPARLPAGLNRSARVCVRPASLPLTGLPLALSKADEERRGSI